MKVAVKDIVNTITQDELDAGKLTVRFDVEVSDGSNMTLPEVFSTEVREDLVKLAVASSRANRRQPYGSRPHIGKRKPMAGMKHSVEWWGKGRGVSRIMRRTGQRRGAQNPHTLGGRRAHGPKVEKDWSRKLNQKERKKQLDHITKKFNLELPPICVSALKKTNLDQVWGQLLSAITPG